MSRSDEMKRELDKIDERAVGLFEEMDFSDVKHQKVMLSVLWFTAQATIL